MDHPSYLEQHREIVTPVLPEVSIRQGRGDHEGAADLVTQLRAKLDSLWAERMAEASREVRP